MRPSKPHIELSQAEQWSREIYGIEATASALPGDVDRNFLLTTEDGSRSVLKVAEGRTIPLELECQVAALEHLERTELGSLLPRPVPALDGRPFRELRTANDTACLVRMVSYLEGRPMATLGLRKPELNRSVGRTLGHVDRELESFDHRGARRHLVWDLAHVAELRPLAGAVDADLRPLVLAGLDRFDEQVTPRLGLLRASVIHNDANDHNLLVDEAEDGRLSLSGLIDFGDMVHTFTVAELAIACAYAMLDVEDPAAAAAEVTAGYEETLKLSDLERELLPQMIVARLCASLLMSARARQTSPDDAYLAISKRPAEQLLRMLSG
jgi:Ser/Thr protein kinase RdoA (MazF antagonist)